MTTQEQIKFAANVQIGTEIQGYGNQILVVTEINKHGFKGYSKYVFEKFGKKTASVYLTFETIQNPHYNKSIKILN